MAAHENTKALGELLKASPENLAALQHGKLKQHVLETLKAIAHLVKMEQYESIEDHTDHSSSGDGYGQENDFIDFAWDIHSVDIMEAVRRLIQLRKMSQEEEVGA